eukprot:COSAG05_NODE_1309_length_5222_cov_9.690611_1_plen_324_part_00
MHCMAAGWAAGLGSVGGCALLGAAVPGTPAGTMRAVVSLDGDEDPDDVAGSGTALGGQTHLPTEFHPVNDEEEVENPMAGVETLSVGAGGRYRGGLGRPGTGGLGHALSGALLDDPDDEDGSTATTDWQQQAAGEQLGGGAPTTLTEGGDDIVRTLTFIQAFVRGQAVRRRVRGRLQLARTFRRWRAVAVLEGRLLAGDNSDDSEDGISSCHLEDTVDDDDYWDWALVFGAEHNHARAAMVKMLHVHGTLELSQSRGSRGITFLRIRATTEAGACDNPLSSPLRNSLPKDSLPNLNYDTSSAWKLNCRCVDVLSGAWFRSYGG